jgi:hypothetical protein
MQTLAQLLKTDAAPQRQRQRQIHIAEPARPLDPNALQMHRHLRAVVVEQVRLCR